MTYPRTEDIDRLGRLIEQAQGTEAALQVIRDTERIIGALVEMHGGTIPDAVWNNWHSADIERMTLSTTTEGELRIVVVKEKPPAATEG